MGAVLVGGADVDGDRAVAIGEDVAGAAAEGGELGRGVGADVAVAPVDGVGRHGIRTRIDQTAQAQGVA